MRKLTSALLFTVAASFALAASPSDARADGVIEASLGKGWEVEPASQQQALNLMVAPGLSFSIIKLQLGLVADIPDVEASNFDIGIRPMLTISPPVLPLYARAIFAVNHLTESGNSKRSWALGGAVGLSFGVAGISIFGEAGILPRSLNDEFHWIVEGRLGVGYEF